MTGPTHVLQQSGTLRRSLPASLIGLCALFLVPPGPAEAQSFDGPWCGRSTQDIEISFTVAGGSIAEADFGGSIDEGCSLRVRTYGPFSAPITNDSFSITTDVFGTELSLEGTFQSPQAAAGTVTVTASSSTCNATAEATWAAAPGECIPHLSADPLTRNFGETPVGTLSPQRRVTVTNEGTGDLRIVQPPRLIGGDTEQFTLANYTNPCFLAVLTPTQSCEFRVGYRPMNTGRHSATILIRSNEPEAGDVEVQLLGIGVSAPTSLSSDTSRRSFGEVAVGQMAAWRKVVLTNHGRRAVRLDDVRVLGADRGQFTMSGDQCSSASLLPGRSCRFRVSFEPTAAGERRALAVIRSDDTEASEIRVQLRGTGVVPGGPVEPDLVLLNAEVLTMDGFDTVASAIRIRDGQILAVGDDVGPLDGPEVEVIDLGGSTVIPGLVGSGEEWPVSDARAWQTAYGFGFTSVAGRSEQGGWGRLTRRVTGETAALHNSLSSPWRAIQAGVVEGMQRLETLRLFTRVGPGEAGSIEVGRRADLVVLSGDFLAVPDGEIGDLTSVLTLVEGVVVFERYQPQR